MVSSWGQAARGRGVRLVSGVGTLDSRLLRRVMTARVCRDRNLFLRLLRVPGVCQACARRVLRVCYACNKLAVSADYDETFFSFSSAS